MMKQLRLQLISLILVIIVYEKKYFYESTNSCVIIKQNLKFVF